MDANWHPIPGTLLTRWAQDVSPEHVLPEYPRPQLVREEWLNLNGLWEYAVTPKEQDRPASFEGTILVPFPLESTLSGVRRALLPAERLWYRRTFSPPPSWRGRKVLLHLGAVDWEAAVWVNGHLVGTHRGGYTPFTFEISSFLSAEGEQELLIAVFDPTDTSGQPYGKQTLRPNTIWYTAVSGIWQTVWLEPVPATYVERLKLTPDLEAGCLRVRVQVAGGQGDEQVELAALDEGALVAAVAAPAGEELTLWLAQPKLWSPATPHLYDLQLRLSRGGQLLDQVTSYFGMRSFTEEYRDHAVRLCLNGEPLFQLGPLDQGYWPDGLYTAPTDEALRFDIEFARSLGFNMIRKHVKVEPARWYYHCDRLGMIVWQDMPNGGKFIGNTLSTVALMTGLTLRDDRGYERYGRGDPTGQEEFREELREMIDSLYNSPCIGLWTIFNEGWGQFDAAALAAWVQEHDPTRLVDHASGWFDQRAGDVRSTHIYFKKLRLPRPGRGRAAVLSEFGGYSLPLPGHLWRPDKQFGYKAFKTTEELTAAYAALFKQQLAPLLARGLAAAVYTQLTDVEIEVNGYLTYDRQVAKMEEEQIRRLHKELTSAHTKTALTTTK